MSVARSFAKLWRTPSKKLAHSLARQFANVVDPALLRDCIDQVTGRELDRRQLDTLTDWTRAEIVEASPCTLSDWELIEMEQEGVFPFPLFEPTMGQGHGDWPPRIVDRHGGDDRR